MRSLFFAGGPPFRALQQRKSTRGHHAPRLSNYARLSNPAYMPPSGPMNIKRRGYTTNPEAKPSLERERREADTNTMGWPSDVFMCSAIVKPSYSITSSMARSTTRPHIRQLEGALLQRTTGPYIGSPNPVLIC